MLQGEDAAAALAPGTARRAALDAALAELDAGREEPSVEWRREYSLMLGLERLLGRGGAAPGRRHDAVRPSGGRALGHADRAHLRAAGRATAQRQRRPHGAEELHSGEVELEGDELRRRGAARLGPGRGGRGGGRRRGRCEDPGAARRFWFEHATGAGKTVAALGFVEASRTGGILILTHRRNLVDQFLGELRDRGYRKRIAAPLLKNGERAAGRRAR